MATSDGTRPACDAVLRAISSKRRGRNPDQVLTMLTITHILTRRTIKVLRPSPDDDPVMPNCISANRSPESGDVTCRDFLADCTRQVEPLGHLRRDDFAGYARMANERFCGLGHQR